MAVLLPQSPLAALGSCPVRRVAAELFISLCWRRPITTPAVRWTRRAEAQCALHHQGRLRNNRHGGRDWA